MAFGLGYHRMLITSAVQQGYKTGPSTILPSTQSLPHAFMSSADTLAYAKATISIHSGKRDNELQPYCAGAVPRMRSVSPVRQVAAAVSRKRRTEAPDDESDTEVEDDAMDIEVPAGRQVKPLRRSARQLQATQSAPTFGRPNELSSWVGRTDF